MRAEVIAHSKPKRGSDRSIECAEMALDVELPFVPTKGTMLKLTPAGPFLEVNTVYWDVLRPDVMQVVMCEPESDLDLPKYKDMVDEGWREVDGDDDAESDAASSDLRPRG